MLFAWVLCHLEVADFEFIGARSQYIHNCNLITAVAFSDQVVVQLLLLLSVFSNCFHILVAKHWRQHSHKSEIINCRTVHER